MLEKPFKGLIGKERMDRKISTSLSSEFLAKFEAFSWIKGSFESSRNFPEAASHTSIPGRNVPCLTKYHTCTHCKYVNYLIPSGRQTFLISMKKPRINSWPKVIFKSNNNNKVTWGNIASMAPPPHS